MSWEEGSPLPKYDLNFGYVILKKDMYLKRKTPCNRKVTASCYLKYKYNKQMKQ